MLKRVATGVVLSFLIAGPALAAEGGEGAGGEGTGTAAAGRQEGLGGPGQAAALEASAAGKGEPPEYSLGVSGFLRGEGAGNFALSDYSYTPGHSEGRLVYRLRPYLTWQPADHLGFLVEGQGYGLLRGGHRDGDVSLYQGYLDARIPGSDLVTVRAGRQEFSYGSAFMLGSDSFYNGLSFDALRLRVQPFANLAVDILGGFYASPWADGVKGNLSGAYASWTPSEGNGLDLYLLRDTGSTFRYPGEELYSWGARATAKLGPFSLELEPVYQSGEVFNHANGGNDNISAYGGHADLAVDLTLGGLRHKFSLGYALGSGSRSSAEGGSTRREFRNANNDTCQLGDMNVIGDLSGANVAGHHASGMQIYTFGWGVELSKQVSFSAAGHYFSAGEVEPGLSRDLGLETDINLSYAFSDNISLTLAYDRFFTGAYFKGVTGSGDDIHYGYGMLQFKFEKAKPKAAPVKS